MVSDSNRRVPNALLLTVLLYLAVNVFLAIRPRVPEAYAWFHGSNVGAFNMFSAHVDALEQAFLVGSDGQRIPISHRQFLWRNPFINTTHSHLDPSVVQRFSEFLASRPEVRALVPVTSTSWQVVFIVNYSRDHEPTRQVVGSAPITLGIR
jgi:hypothetical protein